MTEQAFTSVASELRKPLGLSIARVDAYIADLKRLGFIVNEGRTSMRGTQVRRLDLTVLSKQDAQIGEQDSRIDQDKTLGLAKQDSRIEGSGSQIEAAKLSSRTIENRPRLTAQQPTTTNRTDAVNLVSLWFTDKTQDMLKGVTKAQTIQANQYLNTWGEHLFHAAADAWVEDAPWNAATTSHLHAFLKNFDAYLKRAEQKNDERVLDTKWVMNGWYWFDDEFELTDDEKKFFARFKAFLKAGRELHPAERASRIDLRTWPVFRAAVKRHKGWCELNKEYLDARDKKRDQEQMAYHDAVAALVADAQVERPGVTVEFERDQDLNEVTRIVRRRKS